MKKSASLFLKALPQVILFTLTCFLIYIVSQQVYRLSANDPQYQLVEDYTQALNQGVSPGMLVNPAFTIELGKSLSPFVIIVDREGKLLTTNASLNHIPQTIPKNLVKQALKGDIQATTWQPEPGIRLATVFMAAGPKKDYVVMAGRSLKRIEERIDILGEQVLIGWFISLIIYIMVIFVIPYIEEKF